MKIDGALLLKDADIPKVYVPISPLLSPAPSETGTATTANTTNKLSPSAVKSSAQKATTPRTTNMTAATTTTTTTTLTTAEDQWDWRSLIQDHSCMPSGCEGNTIFLLFSLSVSIFKLLIRM